MKSEAINEIAKALNSAQRDITGAKLDSKNPFFKSKYADLTSVTASVREPLAKNDLSYTQVMGKDEQGQYVETILMHISGQYISGKCYLILGKQDMQQLGSALTYARRYSLMAIVGIAPEDDDGENAMAPIRNPVKPGDYVPNFGKYKGMKLSNIDRGALEGYVEFIESSAKADGKEITGPVKEFISMVEKFLGV